MEIKERILTEKVVDIKCDICQQSCARECGFEYATLSAYWGYDSNKDGQNCLCHLCETCYDKVAEFIVSLGKESNYVSNIRKK